MVMWLRSVDIFLFKNQKNLFQEFFDFKILIYDEMELMEYLSPDTHDTSIIKDKRL